MKTIRLLSLAGVLVVGAAFAEESQLAKLKAALESPDYATAAAAREELKDISGFVRVDRDEAAKILNDMEARSIAWLEANNAPGGGKGVFQIEVVPETRAHDLKHLFHVGPVLHVSLVGKLVRDEHLSVLNGMPNLRMLNVIETSVTGKEVPMLRLPALRLLHICDAPLSPEFFKEHSFPDLQLLDVQGTPFDDKTLASLDCPELVELWVARTAVTSAGLASLVRLKKLEFLRCDAVAFNEDVARLLRDRLELKGCRLYSSNPGEVIKMKKSAIDILWERGCLVEVAGD